MKLAVRVSMVSLVPDFLALVASHVEKVVESWRQIIENNNQTANVSATTRIFLDTADLVHLAENIAVLPASAHTAIKVFDIVFRRTMSELWISQKPKFMICILFDEALLRICRQLRADHGIQALQGWRAQWTERSLSMYGYRWNCEPFVVLSMQYINECCARGTARLLVNKVVEGRLPVELADCILDQTLADNFPVTPNVPARDRNFELFEPDASRISKTGRKEYTCCPHLNNLYPQECVFWAAAEGKYVRFHSTSPSGIINSNLARAGAFRFSNSDGKHVNERFWARCSEAAREVGRTKYILVPDGPLPSGEDSRHLWEVDHGVGRDWRIVKDCTAEF